MKWRHVGLVIGGLVVLGLSIYLLMSSYKIYGYTNCSCPAVPSVCPCAGEPMKPLYAFDVAIFLPSVMVAAFGAYLAASGIARASGRRLP